MSSTDDAEDEADLPPLFAQSHLQSLHFSVLQFLEDVIGLNEDAFSWLRSSREMADKAIHAEKM